MEQFKDPETELPVNLYSDRFNQLLNNYTEEDLLKRRFVTPLKYNRQSVFIDDVLYNIIIHLDIKDIENLCITQESVIKLCQDKSLWLHLLKRDDLYLDYINQDDLSLSGYKKLDGIKNQVIKLMQNQNFNLGYGYDFYFIFELPIDSDISFLPATLLQKLEHSDEDSYFPITHVQITFWKMSSDILITLVKGDMEESIHIPIQQVINLSIYILYHYPDSLIIDG